MQGELSVSQRESPLHVSLNVLFVISHGVHAWCNGSIALGSHLSFHSVDTKFKFSYSGQPAIMPLHVAYTSVFYVHDAHTFRREGPRDLLICIKSCHTQFPSAVHRAADPAGPGLAPAQHCKQKGTNAFRHITHVVTVAPVCCKDYTNCYVTWRFTAITLAGPA